MNMRRLLHGEAETWRLRQRLTDFAFVSVATEPYYDFNEDGEVTILDIPEIASHWRRSQQDSDWDEYKHFDLDSDGAVTTIDIQMVIEQLGRVC